jgi:hypothetical protein
MSVNAANTTPNLRTNHVNSSLLRKGEKNRIARLLTNITGRDGVWVRNKGNRIEISLRDAASVISKNKSFACSTAGYVCTVQPGTIRMHGLAEYPLSSAGTVTLTGSTEYVYLEVARGETTGTTPDIKHSSTEPATTSTHLRIPLCKYTSTVAGSYTLERILHDGDVQLDTPLA